MLPTRITCIAPAGPEFQGTVWHSQLTDFTGLTYCISPMESELHIEQVASAGEDVGWRRLLVGSTFDIFKETSDGPLWVEAIQGLEEAKERLAHLVLISPAEYFIHSQGEGVVARQSQT